MTQAQSNQGRVWWDQGTLILRAYSLPPVHSHTLSHTNQIWIIEEAERDITMCKHGCQDLSQVIPDHRYVYILVFSILQHHVKATRKRDEGREKVRGMERTEGRDGKRKRGRRKERGRRKGRREIERGRETKGVERDRGRKDIDGREMEGRWKGDGREMEGRWKGDGREMEGRWKGDGKTPQRKISVVQYIINFNKI